MDRRAFRYAGHIETSLKDLGHVIFGRCTVCSLLYKIDNVGCKHFWDTAALSMKDISDCSSSSRIGAHIKLEMLVNISSDEQSPRSTEVSKALGGLLQDDVNKLILNKLCLLIISLCILKLRIRVVFELEGLLTLLKLIIGKSLCNPLLPLFLPAGSITFQRLAVND